MSKSAGLAIACYLTLSLLGVALVGMSTLASDASCPPQLRPIREHIVSLIEQGEIPSIAVGVVHGALRWEEGFGLADRKTGMPATAQTLYGLASISKPFTATALMILVERGLISLEDPVNAYLGADGIQACIGTEDAATIRRVASHTSGLPLHSQAFYVDEPYLPPPFEETLRRYGNLVTAPGERYQYSNLGYGILGYIIEQVSETSFERFLTDEVLGPLKMERTTIGCSARLAGSYATNYGTTGQPIPVALTDCLGASGVYSCVSDLLNFALFHMGSPDKDQTQVLTAISRQEMQTPSPGTVRTRDWECEGSGYGLGWFIGRMADGLQVVYHNGGSNGISTVLILVPEEDLAVVVLSNTVGPWPDALVIEILSTLIPERLAHICPAESSGPEVDLLTAEPGLSGRWRGSVETYEGSVQIEARIDELGVVWIRLGDAAEVRLRETTYMDRMPLFLNAGGGPFLRGWFPGGFGTQDVRRGCPCKLWLELKLRGQRLMGSLITFSQRLQYTGPLSHWTELKRGNRTKVSSAQPGGSQSSDDAVGAVIERR